MHIFNPVILREYDIRGTVGKNLTPVDALALGKAYGTMVSRLGGKRIMVGYDGRTHSPDFEQALVEGLVTTGVQVERIGLGPTPMLYFATYHAKADAGIMVTGSHNPPDQNGFKMLIAPHMTGGGPVYGDRIKQLAALAAQGDFITSEGSAKQVAIMPDYLARLRQDFNGKALKVAWDIGNGAAGDVVRELVKHLPGEHILLFPEIDGTFPNHHPDPTVAENLIDLQKAVIDNNCDFGVAFDGDADRIGAVDGQGRIVAGDQLLAIYASEVLQSRPGATIIADVKASQTLFDAVASMGGKPLMWKTGHSLIKVKMAETNSPLAGEMSGHIFFADKFYGFDDAIYCAIRLLNIISQTGKSLAAFRDALPQTINTPEIRFDVDESRKFPIIEEVKARLKQQAANVNDTDGVRVLTNDGWWLLRASNTQAVLVARAEASNQQSLESLKEAIRAQLVASGISPPSF